MKLWDKGEVTDKDIENFTTGRDPELDLYLAPYDALGTLAHATMLCRIGILAEEELGPLKKVLTEIYREAVEGSFAIEPGNEDVHSQIENRLTGMLGDTGRKVHTGRSRNDQVLVDMHLFIREEIRQLSEQAGKLFNNLCDLSERYKELLMPGYTHFQVAMPSSFGLWFASYAEDLTDDMIMLEAAYRVASQNPLGSAAGFGSSIPVDRQLTTELLGFESLRYNVMHAMMSRGKLEKITAQAISSMAGTLSRLAMDICTYMGQNYSFITLDTSYTTGSSIMPHKKNPDVFELVRAKCNRLRSQETEVELVITNLSSGYHRDFQVLKEILIPAFDELSSCIRITGKALGGIRVREDILEDPVYRYISSVDRVNQLVMDGMTFREAYRAIAKQISEGTFEPAGKPEHSHEGSLGNLCLDEIRKKMDTRIAAFGFEKAVDAIRMLIQE